MSEDNKQSSGIVNFKNLMIENGIETIWNFLNAALGERGNRISWYNPLLIVIMSFLIQKVPSQIPSNFFTRDKYLIFSKVISENTD